MAPALSAQTSGQIAGWPAATRVMSRNPPAASRSRAASPRACVGGRVHEGGGHQVGHVGDHGHQTVVVRRRRGRRRRRRGRHHRLHASA